MKEPIKSRHQSKDLMLSAAFLAKDIPLVDTKNSGSYLTFFFGSPTKCQKIEQAWWSGTLSVNATKYADSLKRLKGLIHSKAY